MGRRELRRHVAVKLLGFISIHMKPPLLKGVQE